MYTSNKNVKKPKELKIQPDFTAVPLTMRNKESEKVWTILSKTYIENV
jgi:hypothetical protein